MPNLDQMRIALLAAITNKNPMNIRVAPKWMGTCAPIVSYETVKGSNLSYEVSDPFYPSEMERMASGRAMSPLAEPSKVMAHPNTYRATTCNCESLNMLCPGATNPPILEYQNVAMTLLKQISSDEDSAIVAALEGGIKNVDPFAFDDAKFFSRLPKKVANLQPFCNHFDGELNAAFLQKLVAESMKIKFDDGTSFKVRMNTLIVPPAMFAAAMQASQVEDVVYTDKDGSLKTTKNWIAVSRMIHQIVVMDINPKTWYLCESFNASRAIGALSLIVNPTFEVDSDVLGIHKCAAVAYGLSPLIIRCDLPDPPIRQQIEAFLAGSDLPVSAAEMEQYLVLAGFGPKWPVLGSEVLVRRGPFFAKWPDPASTQYFI